MLHPEYMPHSEYMPQHEQSESALQRYLDTTIAEKAVHFRGPWPQLIANTQLDSVSALALTDKLPHKNTAPIIFLGDSCHAMSPYSGKGSRVQIDADQCKD